MQEQTNKKIYKLGVISDTHGLLRPAVIKILEDCDYIVHAGDIDRPPVLEMLETLAPVAVVRGNNDRGFWAAHLREWINFTVGGIRILLIHNKAYLPVPLPETDVVISGHSHRFFSELRDGVLWLNPGSCGRPRFGGDLSMAVLKIENGQCHVNRIDITPV